MTTPWDKRCTGSTLLCKSCGKVIEIDKQHFCPNVKQKTTATPDKSLERIADALEIIADVLKKWTEVK